jgi:hypothetical protein
MGEPPSSRRVYDGEWGKHDEYARTLPPFLVE